MISLLYQVSSEITKTEDLLADARYQYRDTLDQILRLEPEIEAQKKGRELSLRQSAPPGRQLAAYSELQAKSEMLSPNETTGQMWNHLWELRKTLNNQQKTKDDLEKDLKGKLREFEIAKIRASHNPQ